jgi:hypothetical protein
LLIDRIILVDRKEENRGKVWKNDREENDELRKGSERRDGIDGRDCAGTLEQSLMARNRIGLGLSYRPARLHRLAESIPWNRFLGTIPGPLKSLKMPSLNR